MYFRGLYFSDMYFWGMYFWDMMISCGICRQNKPAGECNTPILVAMVCKHLVNTEA
jgi:hypothetical protein